MVRTKGTFETTIDHYDSDHTKLVSVSAIRVPAFKPVCQSQKAPISADGVLLKQFTGGEQRTKPIIKRMSKCESCGSWAKWQPCKCKRQQGDKEESTEQLVLQPPPPVTNIIMPLPSLVVQHSGQQPQQELLTRKHQRHATTTAACDMHNSNNKSHSQPSTTTTSRKAMSTQRISTPRPRPPISLLNVTPTPSMYYHKNQPDLLEQTINPYFRLNPPRDPQQLRPSMLVMPNNANAVDMKTVFNVMCWKDAVYHQSRDPLYFDRHPQVTANMRSILVHWMGEVCSSFRFHRETYYLAVDILDRFMSKTEMPVGSSNLQLVGVTALHIAAKHEEIYPPKLTEMADTTDGACVADDVKELEIVILKVLQWSVLPITAANWLALYLQLNECGNGSIEKPQPQQQPVECFRRVLFADITNHNNNNSHNARNNSAQQQQQHLIQHPNFDRTAYASICQLLDLCMLDAGWLCFPYGVLAAAALYLMTDNAQLAFATSGFDANDVCLYACVSWMRPFQCVIYECDTPRISVDRYTFQPQHATHVQTVNLQMLEQVPIKLQELNEQARAAMSTTQQHQSQHEQQQQSLQQQLHEFNAMPVVSDAVPMVYIE